MKIPQISSVETRPQILKKSFHDDLIAYAQYCTESSNTTYHISDIVAYVLQDEKKLAQIPQREAEAPSKVRLKMPSRAWANLDAKADVTGYKPEEFIEQACSGLLKNKDFLGWKAKRASESQSIDNKRGRDLVENLQKKGKSGQKGASGKEANSTKELVADNLHS